MNKLNISLTVLLLILTIYGFWPNYLNNLLRWLTDYDFFIQALAVGLGVFGGMWADKKLQEHETIRRTAGALEVIDAELQSNIRAVTNIKDVIDTRPSLVDRSIYSSEDVIKMVENEEQWVANISRQIVDTGYYIVLPTISMLDNRKLFEKIVNAYLKLRGTQLVLGLAVMNSFSGFNGYSEEQKKEVIKMGDQHFNKLSEGLALLGETFKSTDSDIIEEEKKFLDRIKWF